MKADMEAFFTREKANMGVRVPLWLPNGTKSDHYLQIMGVDSDTFRIAEANSRREAMDIAQIPVGTARDQAIQEAKLKLIASLVLSWSFDYPCTFENVLGFLREAPQLADAIDRVSSKRALFFAQGSSSLQTSLDLSSDSTESPKDPSSRSEPA